MRHTCGGLFETVQLGSSEISLKEVINRDKSEDGFNCRISPLFRWLEKRSSETIFKNVAKVFGLSNSEMDDLLNDGFDYALNIKNRDSNGRITEMEIVIPGKILIAKNYQIRKIFADKNGRALPSNLFLILKTDEDADDLYIIGAGFGHGRGLCQWGAIGMSLKSFSFQDILEFYYPGFNLQKIY
jgi:SpoIID/LytB domain protein